MKTYGEIMVHANTSLFLAFWPVSIERRAWFSSEASAFYYTLLRVFWAGAWDSPKRGRISEQSAVDE